MSGESGHVLISSDLWLVKQLTDILHLRTYKFEYLVKRFAHEKIEWPEEYTASKVIPLLTLYDMKQIINQSNHQVAPSENAVKPKLYGIQILF